MVTFLAGGTGTPKLLAGADDVFSPAATTVVANTGDDIELGGHLVCPDLDTVLFLDGEVLDRETWWGIADDTAETHSELTRLADAAGLDSGPRYLPDDAQTEAEVLPAGAASPALRSSCTSATGTARSTSRAPRS